MNTAPEANTEQGTDEWLADRAGCLTASEFWAFVERKEPTKAQQAKGLPGDFYAERARIIRRIAVERLIGGVAKDEINSRATAHGKEMEPFGVEAYEIHTGNVVEKAGFLKHPSFPSVGASPDGLIGSDGGLEAKCPKDPLVHAERLEDAALPASMPWQCTGGMWVTGRQWWDWISYDARFAHADPRMCLLIQRVERDEADILRLERAVLQAEAEVQALIAELKKRVA